MVLNPVHAGVVAAPGDRRWSSYLAMAGLAPVLPRLTTATILATFGPTKGARRGMPIGTLCAIASASGVVPSPAVDPGREPIDIACVVIVAPGGVDQCRGVSARFLLNGRRRAVESLDQCPETSAT